MDAVEREIRIIARLIDASPIRCGLIDCEIIARDRKYRPVSRGFDLEISVTPGQSEMESRS